MAPLFAASPLWLGLAMTVAVLVLVVNWLVYRHAYAMTHFVRPPVPDGGRWRQLWCGVPQARAMHQQTPADFGLPFETHELQGGSERLAAWYVPNRWRRGTVLLFHGYRDCKANLLAEAQAFHELGYACFLVDFPGSGDSGGDDTTIGLREGLDVARAVDYVRDHWRNETLILFGALMGGAAVLRAVDAHHVEPDALVLEGPFDRLVNAVAARCRLQGVPAFPAAWLLVFWGGLRLGFNGFRHNPADYARAVRCPVLLLHGTDDAKAPVEQVRAIVANLKGDKHVHAFAGLGHESCVEKRPDEWKQQVRRFLLGRAEVVVLRAS